MKDRAVITLPLSPKKSDQLCRLVTPVVGETLSKIIPANFHLCINILDSFSDRTKYEELYRNNINAHGIEYHELWKDTLHTEELLEKIEKLIKNGFIYEQTAEIYRCECGIIDIEKKNLETCNPTNTYYKILDGKLVCSKCNNECKLYREKALIFDPSQIKNLKPIFKPDFLNKDTKTFENTILNSHLIISRNRNTGVQIMVNGNIYNIDIDFLWGTYLSLFEESEKVVLCGNKELYQLFLIGTIEKCLDKNAKTIFVGTPILTGIDECNFDIVNDEDILTKKLAIILNIKWSRKIKAFDEELLKTIIRMPYLRKKQLYEMICEEQKDASIPFETILNNAMNERFNLQTMVMKLKKRR